MIDIFLTILAHINSPYDMNFWYQKREKMSKAKSLGGLVLRP